MDEGKSQSRVLVVEDETKVARALREGLEREMRLADLDMDLTSRKARRSGRYLEPVLKALRKNGLDVIAIHHHMTGDRPVAFLKMPDGPDVIKFDPGLGRIYVACYNSGTIAVFHQDDPDHYRKVEDFRVQQAVHTLAVDLKTHRVYTPEQE
jgi:hypothetical protein